MQRVVREGGWEGGGVELRQLKEMRDGRRGEGRRGGGRGGLERG